MIDLIKNFLDSLKGRIKDPVIGKFTISWILINWKLVSILLFANCSVEEKIKIIEEKYISIENYLLIPLGITLFYVLIFPYIMWGIDSLIKLSKEKRKKNVTSLLILDVTEKQKIVDAELKLEKIKAEQKSLQELNDKIEFLNEEIKLKDDYIEKQKKQSIVQSHQIKKDEITEKYKKDYLNFLQNKLSYNFEQIGLAIKDTSMFPQHVSSIIKEKYIAEDIVKRLTKLSFEFTEKGEYFWKEYINSKDISFK
ncbi:hypothetical protein [Tenacibaculum aiptasiae]|uniref:hypothetical protein n=1 Tax=Tenacibaculum aiptasiae TaxID=426481 RepID=UPI00232D0869|nr:hypothetical protein [Tenacibaculum aiptasiae]